VNRMSWLEGKAVNVRYRLFVLGVVLALVLSAVAPSPAFGKMGCGTLLEVTGANERPTLPGPIGPPPDGPMCEPDPLCDPTTQSCGPASQNIRLVVPG
jgi:hypothetical protein